MFQLKFYIFFQKINENPLQSSFLTNFKAKSHIHSFMPQFLGALTSLLQVSFPWQ